MRMRLPISPWLGRLGPGLLLVALATTGCDQDGVTPVAGPTVAGLDDGRALATTAPAPAPVLPCDGKTIEFTTEGSGVSNSSGGGDTLDEAMKDAVSNAIVDNVLGQYSCRSCPPGWPCEPFWNPDTVKTAGAYLEGNPGDNCSEKPDGTWVCHGDVNFGRGSTKPSAEAGCRTCQDSWLPQQWTPVSGRN